MEEPWHRNQGLSLSGTRRPGQEEHPGPLPGGNRIPGERSRRFQPCEGGSVLLFEPGELAQDSFSTVTAAFERHRDTSRSFSPPGSRLDESRYIDQLPSGDLLVTWVIWAN
jgi:hypothetical protein